MAVSARRRGGKRDIENVASETVLAQPLLLPRSLDLTYATSLTHSLLKHRGAHLTIDASQVQHLGGQCLQVLLSATKAWAEDGMNLVLRDGSSRFYEDLQLLGIDPTAHLIGTTAQ
jgi:anti-anti-sigma regulatory factor